MKLRRFWIELFEKLFLVQSIQYDPSRDVRDLGLELSVMEVNSSELSSLSRENSASGMDVRICLA